MPETYLRLIAPEELLPSLQDFAVESQVQLSKPQPADSSAEPLNSPLAGSEVIAALTVVTVALAAGKSLLDFLTVLIKFLDKEKKELEVTDVSCQKRVVINGNTDPATLEKKLTDV